MQGAAPPGDARALERAVLDYLRTHPHAADSVQGVARWWLGSAGVTASLVDVESVLKGLVARGVLRSVRLVDGTTLYSKAEPDA
jgi:Fe2+ or Zn2+ uptake regulation protein